MNFHIINLECFIVLNVLVFMLLFSFTVQVVTRQVALIVMLTLGKYFESKAKYLTDLSKLDVPDKVGKFN
jgi:hypothetical protein